MRGRPVLAAAFVLVATGALVAGCAEAETIDRRACPPGGTKLTYESFGRDFFDVWCFRCHGAGNGYSSRSFVTLASIRDQKDRIYVNAAADNTSMPPGPDDPPAAEREKLAEWLACGAP